MDKGGVEANSQLTLEDFQSQVAFDLVNIGKLTVASASKRGRPSSSTPPPKKKVSPEGESHYDQGGHFPTHSEKQNRCWFCQNGRSRWMCSKCGIYLCLVKERNCFFDFHVKR